MALVGSNYNQYVQEALQNTFSFFDFADLPVEQILFSLQKYEVFKPIETRELFKESGYTVQQSLLTQI